MGSSNYSKEDYNTRSTLRSSTAASKGISVNAATFAHDHDIKSGSIAAAVHATLNPEGVKIRESRDSKEHPVSVPIGVIMDTTGSMAQVPSMLQKDLTKLMGCFLDDKASGKKYLGDGYPAILIGAVDDYYAQKYGHGGEGSLQVGQFESGIEIDDNLTNIWLTGNGGGSYEESYDLAMYFFARHTVHDHWEKRHRKGYLFIIGDEKTYPKVDKEAVEAVLGEKIGEDIPIKAMVDEVKKRYHLFFIVPNMTSHYGDEVLRKHWLPLVGQQNFIELADPHKICETIVGAVAICEEHVGIDEIGADLGFDTTALVALSKYAPVAGHSAGGLVPADAGPGVERL